MERNHYGALNIWQMPQNEQDEFFDILEVVKNAPKVGNTEWEFACKFDRYGRGHAINYDLYGVGRDYHTGTPLYVIQVRAYVKRSKHGFANTWKNYFLIGRNEDGSCFAHAVEARCVHAAIKAGRDVVYAVQSWIFGHDYKDVIRQGDICLVPASSRAISKASSLGGMALNVNESHRIMGADVYTNGKYIWVRDPEVLHLPGGHNPVKLSGLYKVFQGRRANTHAFSPETID